MWFFGWAAGHANPGIPGCDAIFHARSKDLKTWEVYGKDGSWDTTMTPAKWAPVLHASDRWYEAWHVGDPSVVMKDNALYMAYSATSKHFGKAVEGYTVDLILCIMGATSNDGIHWEKTEQPLLIRAGDTANPKPEPGRIGDFHRPSLHRQDGKWRLWFDYRLPGSGYCMGYAENTGDFRQKGGFKIMHDLRKPLVDNWPNPEVIKVGDRYFCFSDPPGYPTKIGESRWMSRQLREAVSDDGMHWTKLAYIPPDDDADACHVPQALVTNIDGKRWLYLFYATQIGYRKNDGKYHYEYDRIRAMRHELEPPRN
jgi:sucrose-6-phosphate hydrolase SacC (GH32 family)